MEKQSVLGPLFGLAARTAGFAATKAAPKMMRMGWKGAIKPMGKLVRKFPGTALTAGFAPLQMGSYMSEARQQTLASMPRKLPSYGNKFASIKGDDMTNDKKHPSVFYKLDGFEKMAAEAETAQRLVKKAFWGTKLFGKAAPKADDLGVAIKKRIIDFYTKDLDGVAQNIIKKVGPDEYFKGMGMAAEQTIKKVFPPKSLGQRLISYAKNMSPVAQVAAVTVPSAYFAEKVIRKSIENNKMNESYKNMLRVHPDLQKEDPTSTKQYFNYIKTYSPTVAKNPHAAGALVKRFTHSGGMLMDNSIIENLLKIEKAKSETSSDSKGILGTLGKLI